MNNNKHINKKKKNTVKKSSSNRGISSTGLLKTLQKMLLEKTGSVAYVFVDERVKNIHSHKLNDLETKEVKANLHVNLPPEAFEGRKEGERKTPNELIHMFETTREDLGAKYFIIE